MFGQMFPKVVFEKFPKIKKLSLQKFEKVMKTLLLLFSKYILRTKKEDMTKTITKHMANAILQTM